MDGKPAIKREPMNNGHTSDSASTVVNFFDIKYNVNEDSPTS